MRLRVLGDVGAGGVDMFALPPLCHSSVAPLHPNWSPVQVALRPFTEEGFQSAGNPGITFVAPEEWCTSAAAVAGVAVTGPSIPGGGGMV